MKVITIKQPFASLIAEGLKEYEFRTWKTKYRGEILIHAGKGIDKKAMKKFEKYSLDYPTGCIIAKDGKNYKTKFYNLDLIIAVGYRVKSVRGTKFRIWANKLIKGEIVI